jgi:CRISPR system Cascade subunit CasB
MRGCAVLWKEDEQRRVLSWWHELQSREPRNGPSRSGWRAELRRVDGPVDALLSRGFYALYLDLSGTWWAKEDNLPGLAAVAGILAHIETDDESHSFAESCAIPRDEMGKPPVSELRFSQLQKSRTLDELFMRMRRTIQLLRRKTNVISTADSILHWYRENEHGDVNVKRRDRLLVRWGLDYFQQLPREK